MAMTNVTCSPSVQWMLCKKMSDKLILGGYGAFYVITSLIIIIAPDFFCNSLFQQSFRLGDFDNYSLIIFDMCRSMAIIFILMSFLLFSMMTIHERTTMRKLNFGWSVFALLMTVLSLTFVFSKEHRWKALPSVLVLAFFLVKFAIFTKLWLSDWRRDRNMSLPQSNVYRGYQATPPSHSPPTGFGYGGTGGFGGMGSQQSYFHNDFNGSFGGAGETIVRKRL